MHRSHLHFAFLMTVLLSWGSVCAQNLPLSNLANVPAAISETSGLVVTSPNKLWSHNDSGGDPKLYCFDTSGTLLRTLVVSNATNVDWEELTMDAQGRVYIGDFGNNSNNRTDLRIYRIPPPDSVAGDSVTAEIIDFGYPDQTSFPPPASLRKFDMEAMVALNDSLYLFSKNRTDPFDGYTRRYRLPQGPGTYTAELIDSFYCGPGPSGQYWITSAALSPDRAHLVLLSSDRCWVFSCFSGSDFFGAAVVELHYSLSQKEAIAWRDNSTAYITDELVGGVFGGDLYRADLSLWTAEPAVFLGNDTTVTGGPLALNAGGTPGASFLWSTGATASTLNVTTSGTYSVTVTAPNGCTAADTILVDVLAGRGLRGEGPGIRLEVRRRPLPEAVWLSWEMSGPGQVSFEVLDMQGRRVLTRKPEMMAAGQHSEALKLPGEGLYILRFYQDQYTVSQRIWQSY